MLAYACMRRRNLPPLRPDVEGDDGMIIGNPIGNTILYLSLLGGLLLSQIYMYSSIWIGGLGSVQKPIKKFGPMDHGPSSCGPPDRHGPEFLMGL